MCVHVEYLAGYMKDRNQCFWAASDAITVAKQQTGSAIVEDAETLIL